MKSCYEELRIALLDARQAYQFWWLLHGAHDQRAEVLKAFVPLPVIYNTLKPALYTSFIVKLCCLFGTGTKDITLESIPNAKQDSEFSRIWEIGRRIYVLRSKLIVHIDSRCDPDQIAKDTGLTNFGLRDLLYDTISLFDRLAGANGEQGVIDFGIEDEFSNFLTRLGYQNEDAEQAASSNH
jgi:hypothetical protein